MVAFSNDDEGIFRIGFTTDSGDRIGKNLTVSGRVDSEESIDWIVFERGSVSFGGGFGNGSGGFVGGIDPINKD